MNIPNQQPPPPNLQMPPAPLAGGGGGVNPNPPAAVAAAGALPPDPTVVALTAALRDMMAGPRQNARPREIRCKSYKMGDSWKCFKDYFRENIRAHYNYHPGQIVEINNACCHWIGSKLEPGPTLAAYCELAEITQQNWVLLDRALSVKFVDEAERQRFLMDQRYFRRGSRGLSEYKSEVLRLVDTYQPELRQMNAEFERQVVARFIEGLEDDELKKELWMHCRRGRQTIEEAYNRAVDYESSRLSSDTVEPQLAAIEADKSMPRSVSVIRRPLVAAVEQQPDGLV